jgi:hypothetical protein
MELRSLLIALTVWVVYPVWLAAGAVDYLCHRMTDIEHTSGVPESRLHVAQLLCMGVIVALAVLAETTAAVWIILFMTGLLHSALAYIDVSYTQSRRRIAPLEQTAHSFLEVLPLVAVALLAVMHWPLATAPWFAWRAELDTGAALLLGSFAVLAGAPVFEEMWRTSRAGAADSAVAPHRTIMRPEHGGGNAS